MLAKGYFLCCISLLGHLCVSRADYRACDASGVLHSPRARAGTGVPPDHHSWITLTARLCQCLKNAMSLGPAVAGDGWPASSTWLGQRDTSLARTSVGAFQVAHAALPEEHSTRVPSRQDAAAEEIALRISGQNVQGLWLLTLRPCLFSSSRLVAPSRERWLGPGGACDAGKKQM